MSLLSVLEKIKKASELANKSLDGIPYTTIAGHTARKKKAKEDLKTLKEDYIQELTKSAVFVLVTGSEKDAFVKLSTENILCFSADPRSFYIDLAAKVAPANYVGKSSSSSMFDLLGRYLEDTASEMGLVSCPQMVFKNEFKRILKDRNDLVDLIQQVVNKQVGGEIVGLYSIIKLADDAIKSGFAGKTTVVLLGTNDMSLVTDLFRDLQVRTPNVFVVTAGRTTKEMKALKTPFALKEKDVTKEKVEEVLTNISNSIHRL